MWMVLQNRVGDWQQFHAIPKLDDCTLVSFELQSRTSVIHLYHRNVERDIKPISYIHFIPSLAPSGEEAAHTGQGRSGGAAATVPPGGFEMP
jgi:hypothetical protein